MKSENDFNAYLGRELKKLSKKGFSHLKISDRFHPGVSDFFLWHQSIGSAIESKFIDNLPVRGTTKIMTHPFTGAQKGFFKRMEPGGAGRFGLVGIKRYKMMALIPASEIPEDGNWTRTEFIRYLAHPSTLSFNFADVLEMATIATVGASHTVMSQAFPEGVSFNVVVPWEGS